MERKVILTVFSTDDVVLNKLFDFAYNEGFDAGACDDDEMEKFVEMYVDEDGVTFFGIDGDGKLTIKSSTDWIITLNKSEYQRIELNVLQ